MENKSNTASFLERIDALSTGERVALKRSAGFMLSESDGRAISAFYRCIVPSVLPWQEDRYFAVACLKCLWDPVKSAGEPVEKMLAKLIRGETLSESMEHRIESLLDTQWDKDGFFLVKLSRMVKMLRQKTTEEINFASLLEDLLYWNNDNQSVQRKWAREIFSSEK